MAASEEHAPLETSAVSILCPQAGWQLVFHLEFLSVAWGVLQDTGVWLPTDLMISKNAICVVLASQSIRVTFHAARLCDRCWRCRNAHGKMFRVNLPQKKGEIPVGTF